MKWIMHRQYLGFTLLLWYNINKYLSFLWKKLHGMAILTKNLPFWIIKRWNPFVIHIPILSLMIGSYDKKSTFTFFVRTSFFFRFILEDKGRISGHFISIDQRKILNIEHATIREFLSTPFRENGPWRSIESFQPKGFRSNIGK